MWPNRSQHDTNRKYLHQNGIPKPENNETDN